MSLDARQRELFAKLADTLIPASENMPSYSESDANGEFLDAVFVARPDLHDALCELLARVGDQSPADVVKDLQSHAPDEFAVLAEIVPAAYFMNPAIREAIGYSGQGPQPIDVRVDYMEDGLLESVIRRGPVYRPTPVSR